MYRRREGALFSFPLAAALVRVGDLESFLRWFDMADADREYGGLLGAGGSVGCRLLIGIRDTFWYDARALGTLAPESGGVG